MADTSNTKKTPANQVLSRFTSSWDYAKANHHQRWSRNRKLYNNERVNPSYEGVTNTFVPLTFSTVETIVAALGAGRPDTQFTPNDMYKFITSYEQNGTKPDLKALNATYDYYWDCDNWDLKTIKTIRGGLIEGIAGEWIYWDNDKPRIINLRARDIIVDPALKDPMDLLTDPKNHWAGRRFLATLSQLKSERIVDPKTGGTKRRYNNLDQITPGFAGDQETDKGKRDMYTGAAGADNDLVEVIEIWDGNNIRSIANRSQSATIEDRPNETGIIPLALTRFIADEEVVYGKSIIDPIAQSQELLNDVTNQSVDAVTDILTPRWELDPAYSDHIATVAESSFGTVFPFTPGSLRPIDKPVVTNGAFNERQNMKNEIKEATGADSIVQGTQAEGGTTATEINAQLNQAGQRFELFVRMLEKEGFYQRAKIVFKLMLHYQKGITLIPVQTADGPKFHKLNPEEFDDSFEPKIQLSATVDRNKMVDSDKYTKAYQILIQDPTNDLYEAKKVMYPKMFDLDEEQLDKIIGQNNKGEGAVGEDGQPLPPEGEQPPAVDPEMINQMVQEAVAQALEAQKKEPAQILPKFSDLTEYERDQVLEQYGITPDPEMARPDQQNLELKQAQLAKDLLPEIREQALSPVATPQLDALAQQMSGTQAEEPVEEIIDPELMAPVEEVAQ